ncbi:hypothetical protein L2E82_14426 [Cichorium intybus]|uniref:Uncharacterized protein n=1 Tax=Cichorium intybus TaxID=13427 RepID=A0ACB9EZY4_CICIN|nr:hypothetical protein L2E82_14426 [Cichorium intybus]
METIIVTLELFKRLPASSIGELVGATISFVVILWTTAALEFLSLVAVEYLSTITTASRPYVAHGPKRSLPPLSPSAKTFSFQNYFICEILWIISDQSKENSFEALEMLFIRLSGLG